MTDWHQLEHNLRDSEQILMERARRHDIEMSKVIQKHAVAVEALVRARFQDHIEEMPQVFS